MEIFHLGKNVEGWWCSFFIINVHVQPCVANPVNGTQFPSLPLLHTMFPYLTVKVLEEEESLQLQLFEYVLSKIQMLKLNGQGVKIKRWGLKEVINS